ncbi:MAG: aminopeptidase, partial [Desulfuromonadaceae bacterium]|nr:aminopeptidase [Desulfuromonadaceae bacterium]
SLARLFLSVKALNPFLSESPPDRAGTTFHELAHQQLFLPNAPGFSEGLAMAVEPLFSDNA